MKLLISQDYSWVTLAHTNWHFSKNNPRYTPKQNYITHCKSQILYIENRISKVRRLKEIFLKNSIWLFFFFWPASLPSAHMNVKTNERRAKISPLIEGGVTQQPTHPTPVFSPGGKPEAVIFWKHLQTVEVPIRVLIDRIFKSFILKRGEEERKRSETERGEMFPHQFRVRDEILTGSARSPSKRGTSGRYLRTLFSWAESRGYWSLIIWMSITETRFVS